MKRNASGLRYVNEVVGAFVLAAVVFFVAGIYVAGRAQGWFEPRLVLHTVFPPETGALGLQKGAEVRILGTLAGRVGDIGPDDSGRMQATYIIRGRFGELVRTNSVAIVKKKFGVAGDAFVEITMGDLRLAQLAPGAFIQSEEDVEILQIAKNVLEEVMRVAIPLLEEIQNILTHVSGITGSIDDGQGTVGRLIRDPEVAERLNAMLQDLQTATARLPGVMEDVELAGDRLPAVMAELAVLADELRSLAGEVRTQAGELNAGALSQETAATLRETRRLMETLQRHWLLRKYAPPEAASGLMPPVRVPSTAEGMP